LVNYQTAPVVAMSVYDAANCHITNKGLHALPWNEGKPIWTFAVLPV